MIFPNDMLGPYDGWSEYKRYQSEVMMKLIYMIFAGSFGGSKSSRWRPGLGSPNSL